MATEVTEVDGSEVGPPTNCHHFINGVYEHTEGGYFIKRHHPWNKIDWRIQNQPGVSTLAGRSLTLSQTRVHSGSYSTDNSVMILLSLSLRHLALHPQPRLQDRTRENTPQTCGPFQLRVRLAAFCPPNSSCVSFPCSRLCLPNAAQPCSAWAPFLRFRTEHVSGKNTRTLIRFICFFSLSPGTQCCSESRYDIHVTQFYRCLWCEGKFAATEASSVVRGVSAPR